ncbi:hypothetical protein DFR49_3939 [Hephaestia caeni]|uniref:Uncharacterized protein n=1 Tax=Hephaestia caeni TaxID=645617 RepID=A0A397NPH7_9SPHN|nr:hypothetical protein DFR49_3939 [Hephaestia caeni]
MMFSTIIPAKAGTHLPTVAPGLTHGSWVPAFAGMTKGKAA